jgi:oligosaccharide repeat unit polymerase
MPKYLNLYKTIFFSLLSLSIVGIEFLYVNENINYTYFIEIQLIVVYLGVFVHSCIKNGLMNIYTLFLGTLGLFSFMGIFFSIFTEYDYRIVYSLITINFPELILQKTILLYTIFLLTINCSFNFFEIKSQLKELRKAKYTIYNQENSTNIKLLQIGKGIMWLFIILALYRMFLEVKILYNNRSLLFIEGMDGIGLPFYLRLSTTFFQTGYLFILASYPPKNTFLRYSILYIITIIPGLVIGNRMMFVVSVLFVFWYLYKMYNHKFNYVKILILGVVFVIFLQFVAFNRSGIDNLSIGIGTIMIIFLTSQSLSFNILGLYLQYEDIICHHNYPFILDPVIGWLTNVSGQSMEFIDTRASLGHHMIYSLNPGYYANGSSLGTTSIAELYEFRMIGVITGAIIISWFIVKFNYMVIRHRSYMMFSLLIFTTILISPRASFFPNVYGLLKNITFYFVILFVVNILLNRKLSIKKFKRKEKFKIPL